MTKPCFRLRFENSYNEVFYFVRLGDNWPHNPKFFLIGETTPNRADAKCFDSAEEATAILEMCNDPVGWSLDVEEIPALEA